MSEATPTYHPEHSAGGIAYRIFENRLEVAIIYRSYHEDWTLPKGHLEEGETSEQAALREVQEEAGLECELLALVGDSTFRFRERRSKKLIEKKVDYYLMRLLKDHGEVQLEEVDSVHWLPFGEAIRKLTFQRDQDLVKLAIALIPRYQELALATPGK